MFPSATGCFLLVVCATLSGCANRAYNDLYIENMAAEIRDLEDQLYEYDHEYRVLEQELAALRRQNGVLQNSANGDAGTRRSTDPNRPLEFYPRGASPIVPEPALPGDYSPEPSSILEPPADSGVSGRQDERLPVPDSSATLPQADATQDPEEVVPRSPFPSENSPAADDLENFDMDLLTPPTIEAGEPMPPPLPVVTDGRGMGAGSELKLEQSRISIPALLASRQEQSKEIQGARVTPAIEEVKDKRVVEIAFHPSLSRAANFDDQSDDDGLYLVLQPINQAGQMVPLAADLSVVVLDPARPGDQARIGRWDYSAQEVKAKLQPIGSNQGIHLTLPWNGPDPAADRVVVFARYTYPDGRQVIGEKTIFVSPNHGLKTVWAPRGAGNLHHPVAAGQNLDPGSRNGSLRSDRVAQGKRNSTEQSASAIRTAAAHAEPAAHSRVVRPASGSLPAEPAPAPGR